MKRNFYKIMSIVAFVMLLISYKSVSANETTYTNFEYIKTQVLNIYNGSTKIFNKDNIDITNDFIKRFPTEFHLNDSALYEIINEQYSIVEDLTQEINFPHSRNINLYGLVNHSYVKKVTQTTTTYPDELLQGKTKDVTISYYIRGSVTEDATTKKITSFTTPFVNLAYSSDPIERFNSTISAPTYLSGNYGIRITTSVNFKYLFEGTPGLGIPVRALRYSFDYYPSAQ